MFARFNDAYEFINKEIESENGKKYILIFANNMANKVLGLKPKEASEDENQHFINALYPYENVDDYLIYCGNVSIANDIINSFGLHDSLFATSDEGKLMRKLNEIYDKAFNKK